MSIGLISNYFPISFLNKAMTISRKTTMLNDRKKPVIRRFKYLSF